MYRNLYKIWQMHIFLKMFTVNCSNLPLSPQTDVHPSSQQNVIVTCLFQGREDLSSFVNKAKYIFSPTFYSVVFT